MTPRPAYTATTSAPIAAAGAVIVSTAIAAGCIALAHAPAWAVLIVLAVSVLASVQLCRVRLAVGPDAVHIALGACRRARVLPLGSIAAWETATLSWPAVYGLLRPGGWPVSRYTVRAGPTLCLRLHTGEVIRISVPDPGTAVHLLSTLKGAPS